MDLDMEQRIMEYRAAFGVDPPGYTNVLNDTGVPEEVMIAAAGENLNEQQQLAAIHKAVTDFFVKKAAGIRIWTVWLVYRQRKLFRTMVDCICRAENVLTLELLKRLSPREAELVKDPIVQARVRFRFGGETFPPKIMYKIFTTSHHVHYFSANRLIPAGSNADKDACRVMGRKTYRSRVLYAKYVNLKNPLVSELVDVTNRQEYVQYLNSLDTRGPSEGGRSNTWRELQLDTSRIQQVVYHSKEERPHSASILDHKTQKWHPLASRTKDQAAQRAKERQIKINKMRRLYGLDESNNPEAQSPESPFAGPDSPTAFDWIDFEEDDRRIPVHLGQRLTALSRDNSPPRARTLEEWQREEQERLLAEASKRRQLLLHEDTEFNELEAWANRLSFDDYHSAWDQMASSSFV